MNISPLLQYVTFPAGFHDAQVTKWLFPTCDRNADLHNYGELFIYNTEFLYGPKNGMLNTVTVTSAMGFFYLIFEIYLCKNSHTHLSILMRVKVTPTCPFQLNLMKHLPVHF